MLPVSLVLFLRDPTRRESLGHASQHLLKLQFCIISIQCIAEVALFLLELTIDFEKYISRLTTHCAAVSARFKGCHYTIALTIPQLNGYREPQ